MDHATSTPSTRRLNVSKLFVVIPLLLACLPSSGFAQASLNVLGIVGGLNAQANIDKPVARYVRDSFVPIAIGEDNVGGASLIATCKDRSVFLTAAHNFVNEDGFPLKVSIIVKKNINIDGEAGFSNVHVHAIDAYKFSDRFLVNRKNMQKKWDYGLFVTRHNYSSTFTKKQLPKYGATVVLTDESLLISGIGKTANNAELDFTLNYGAVTYPPGQWSRGFVVGVSELQQALILVPHQGTTCGGDSGGAVELSTGTGFLQVGIMFAGDCTSNTSTTPLMDREVWSELREMFDSLKTGCDNPFKE